MSVLNQILVPKRETEKPKKPDGMIRDFLNYKYSSWVHNLREMKGELLKTHNHLVVWK